jgi:hypothetical protein
MCRGDGQQGEAASGAGAGSEDDLIKKLSEQLSGLDSDPNMSGVMEDMMSQVCDIQHASTACAHGTQAHARGA